MFEQACGRAIAAQLRSRMIVVALIRKAILLWEWNLAGGRARRTVRLLYYRKFYFRGSFNNGPRSRMSWALSLAPGKSSSGESGDTGRSIFPAASTSSSFFT